ncbi:hypothetical protein K7432_001619 [Basidiobolus ranarum]|uniref:Uncharacterized protein n=1 Tax=Basidiobolus ranarum TaxID=34480 RepID=A0ABR2W977_9FUNG
MRTIFVLAITAFTVILSESSESNNEGKKGVIDADNLGSLGILKSIPILGDSGRKLDSILDSDLTLDLFGKPAPNDKRKPDATKEYIESTDDVDVDNDGVGDTDVVEDYGYYRRRPSAYESKPRYGGTGRRKYRNKSGESNEGSNIASNEIEGGAKKNNKKKWTTTWTTTYPTKYTTYSTTYRTARTSTASSQPTSIPSNGDPYEKPSAANCLLGICL